MGIKAEILYSILDRQRVGFRVGVGYSIGNRSWVSVQGMGWGRGRVQGDLQRQGQGIGYGTVAVAGDRVGYSLD